MTTTTIRLRRALYHLSAADFAAGPNCWEPMDGSVAPLTLRNLKALKEGEENPVTAFFSDLSGFSLVSETTRHLIADTDGAS